MVVVDRDIVEHEAQRARPNTGLAAEHALQAAQHRVRLDLVHGLERQLGDHDPDVHPQEPGRDVGVRSRVRLGARPVHHDDAAVRHPQELRSVVVLDARSVERETQRVQPGADVAAERAFQLAHRRVPLDFELRLVQRIGRYGADVHALGVGHGARDDSSSA